MSYVTSINPILLIVQRDGIEAWMDHDSGAVTVPTLGRTGQCRYAPIDAMEKNIQIKMIKFALFLHFCVWNYLENFRINLNNRKTGLFRTNFSIFVKFKRHTSKDRSESYAHILMLVRHMD